MSKRSTVRLMLGAIVAVAAASALAPAGALAATASVSQTSLQDDSCRYMPSACDYDVLTYSGAPGEVNTAVVTNNAGATATIADTTANITPGAGCVAIDGHHVSCNITLPGGLLGVVHVLAGDMNDSMNAVGRITVKGGAGSDQLGGDAGVQSFDGGGGTDAVRSGAGDDFLRDGDVSGQANADLLDGGDGFDDVIYLSRTADLRVSLSSSAPTSGEKGEGDTVIGVEAVDGGSGDDTLLGNAAANIFYGGKGRDHLDGRGGPDQLFGERGGDSVKGGRGKDEMSGGPGPDVLLARDGKRDRVSGGKGFDRATVDRRDRVFSVERVRR